MAYAVIEFANSAGGGVAQINSSWLTPRKKEVLWPPIKQQHLFDKVVKSGEVPSESWETFGVSRVFYETGKFVFCPHKIKRLKLKTTL